jgi:PIN domain nuclease of toxin-antitoxin system
MDLLLDTHALLWFALGDSQLSATANSLIRDPANRVFVSPASYWEIAIKMSKGKYLLHVPHATFFEGAIANNGFGVLHIEPRHTEVIVTLVHHHNDPFDRILIAQAIAEGMSILSGDPAFDAYPITRLW